jgi:ankyrin repeat protein
MPLQEALKLLLAHGCNIKASAMDDMNALHFAAQKGQLEAIRRLITAGVCFGSMDAAEAAEHAASTRSSMSNLFSVNLFIV